MTMSWQLSTRSSASSARFSCDFSTTVLEYSQTNETNQRASVREGNGICQSRLDLHSIKNCRRCSPR
jgi:hypothetical protein